MEKSFQKIGVVELGSSDNQIDHNHCSVCNCSLDGKKSWREQNKQNPKVFCRKCAIEHEEKGLAPEFRGKINLCRGNQIGDLVPAIWNGKGFWRYNRLANEALEEWKKLPSE